MRNVVIALAAVFWGMTAALAAPIEEFRLAGVEYDASIETPDEHFGHGLGDKPVRHDQMVAYLSGLAASSERIAMEEIGRTHEGRPILFFTVSSPRNLARIDTIREQHLASLEGAPRPDDAPAIVWINYGVHGAESAGMDAAIPTLYHFAAAQGEEIEEQLENTVILVVAILNPDGHSRRIDHVETFMGAVPVTDPAHAQHDLWTEARTNHYWFDLNRQWLPVSQPEAKAWVTTWHRWKPQVSADFHEMGSNATFYFHPGAPKRKNPLIPDEARELTQGISDFHRAFLDGEARLYYTEQRFDNFYIGKGSTYPQVNGGLGILFEIGAARGGSIESPNGLRSYADNIRTHFRTTLTTIEGTLAQKQAIADYQRRFFAESLEEAERDPVKAHVFTAGGDRSRLYRFARLLSHHDIAVHRLGTEVRVGDMTFTPEDSLVVPMAQAQYRMIRGIFDRLTEFEENIFYDVSGWTLPLAFDLDHAPLTTGPVRAAAGGRFDPAQLGERVLPEDLKPVAGRPQQAGYGYLFSWQDRMAAKALYRLLDEGILARVALEPFEVRTERGLETFDRGAVFVPMAGQTVPERTIHATVRAIAEEDGIEVHTASSGAGEVATDALGGPSFEAVEKPSVLLLFDDGLARYDAGEVWYLLDHEMRMPVTLRRKNDLGGLDWSRYTHLVLVGGNGVLSEASTNRVRQWITEEGGTLIALRQSAAWAQETFVVGRNGSAADGKKPSRDDRLRLDYSELAEKDAEHVIGGAIVATDLDPSHPLGFGYSDRMLPVMRNTTLTLSWPKANPFAIVAAYPQDADDVLLSGYVSEKRREELAGTPAVLAQRVGRGSVILMADNPVFRGMFLGTEKMFLNGLFFSQLISSPSGDYVGE